MVMVNGGGLLYDMIVDLVPHARVYLNLSLLNIIFSVPCVESLMVAERLPSS